jgi:hypothetical protein
MRSENMGDEIILNFFKQLNNGNLLPETSLRRNSIYYRFVSYINNSIACYLSENNNGTIIFINRAYKEMIELKKGNYINKDNIKYFTLCQKYIKITSGYLIDNKLVDENFIQKVNEMNFDFLLK